MFIRFADSLIIILAVMSFQNNGALKAQAQTRQPYLQTENIREAVSQNVGSPGKDIEVLVTGNVLTILRVDSSMNGAEHELVKNEAASIAIVVSKMIADRAEYGKTHTIRVQYIKRSGSPAKDKIVDSVDFRKSPDGVFELHVT